MNEHPKAAFEKALHKAIADCLDNLVEKFGVRVTDLTVTWLDTRPAADLPERARGYIVRALESTQQSDDYGGNPWILKTTQVFPVMGSAPQSSEESDAGSRN